MFVKQKENQCWFETGVRLVAHGRKGGQGAGHVETYRAGLDGIYCKCDGKQTGRL